MAENEKPVEGEEAKRSVSGKSMYKYIAEAWNRPDATYVKDLMFERMINWRREENFSASITQPAWTAPAPWDSRPSRDMSWSADT